MFTKAFPYASEKKNGCSDDFHPVLLRCRTLCNFVDFSDLLVCDKDNIVKNSATDIASRHNEENEELTYINLRNIGSAVEMKRWPFRSQQCLASSKA